jgi:nicotinate-nucleotide adenylyltransferase
MTEKRDAPGAIGIFGGSFNPPHMAHVLACQFALCAWPLERILVVPSFVHPFDKDLAPYEHRLEMARLAFTHIEPWVEVSRIEEEMGGVSYTVETVEELRRRFPKAQLHLIIGSDLVDELPQWKDSARLRKLAPPLVVPRPGTVEEAATGGFALPAISSTEIRDLIMGGGDPGLALPRTVNEYVRRHDLYR